jgi:AcrR family transcriptional regulator
MSKKIKPRKKASQERSKFTVDAIMKATSMLLEESGLKGLTTNKIVEKAGVSIGSLYQYFPGKEAILSLLMEKQFGKHLAYMEEKFEEVLAQDLPLEEALHILFQNLMKDYQRESKIHKELMYSIITLKSLSFTIKNDERAAELVNSFLDKYQSEIKEGIDRDRFIFTIHYAIKGIKFGAVFANREDQLQGIADDLAQMVYGFIKKDS